MLALCCTRLFTHLLSHLWGSEWLDDSEQPGFVSQCFGFFALLEQGVRSIKNPNVSTGPLARQFAHTAHSYAYSVLLPLLARSAALTRSLTNFAHSLCEQISEQISQWPSIDVWIFCFSGPLFLSGAVPLWDKSMSFWDMYRVFHANWDISNRHIFITVNATWNLKIASESDFFLI